MVKLALLPLRVTVPSVVEPSLKLTVPVGLVPETVATKVTGVPWAEGFREEVSRIESFGGRILARKASASARSGYRPCSEPRMSIWFESHRRISRSMLGVAIAPLSASRSCGSNAVGSGNSPVSSASSLTAAASATAP